MGFSMDTDLTGTGQAWTPALIGDRFSRIGACGCRRAESLGESAEFLDAFQMPLMVQVLETPLFEVWSTSGSLVDLHFTDCAGCKVPGLLGGSLELSNLGPSDLSVHLSVLEQLWQPVASAADGSRVTLVQVGDGR